MSELQFFMPMKPPTATHQEKQVDTRGKKPRFFEGDRLADARAKLTAHLSKHRPKKPLLGALLCHVKWGFSTTKKHLHHTWKVTTPDTHNMDKLLFDVMTKLGFWKDDRFVVQEMIEKFYDKAPGISILIRELED